LNRRKKSKPVAPEAPRPPASVEAVVSPLVVRNGIPEKQFTIVTMWEVSQRRRHVVLKP
jgi:hypothetical protein